MKVSANLSRSSTPSLDTGRVASLRNTELLQSHIRRHFDSPVTLPLLILFSNTGGPLFTAGKSSELLFLAVVEATEEAVYNSMLKATTITGRDGHTEEAIPIDRVIEICKKYNVLNWNTLLPSWKKGE